MLRKFDAFEGKAAAPRRQVRTRRSTGARRGSKREELLKVIRDGNGLTRGQILEKMGLKGDKTGEMSVSNVLPEPPQSCPLHGKPTLSTSEILTSADACAPERRPQWLQ
jgi:hypothetical protein